MADLHALLRSRLLRDVREREPSLDELLRTERDQVFEALCMRRKVLGAMRYGRMKADGKPQFDRVEDMVRRLRMYQQDHNAEHLVDVANLAELEFAEGEHVGVLASDDGQHTRQVQRGGE